jgi:hypothetical protein
MNIDYKNCSCGQMATQCKALLDAQTELLLKKTDIELKNKEIEKYKKAMNWSCGLIKNALFEFDTDKQEHLEIFLKSARTSLIEALEE